MSVVSSSYILDGNAQQDGRRYVMELHTDSTGAVHRREYLAAVGADYQTIMEARAVQIADELAEAEANTLTES